MDFGDPLAQPCTSAPPLGTFLENVPFSPPLNIPFMSDLVFLANISLAGYHLLFSLWFLTVDSACRTSQEDLSLLLHTLLCVLRKIFLLLYNNSARTYFLLSYATTTRTSTDVITNNNLYTMPVTAVLDDSLSRPSYCCLGQVQPSSSTLRRLSSCTCHQPTRFCCCPVFLFSSSHFHFD